MQIVYRLACALNWLTLKMRQNSECVSCVTIRPSLSSFTLLFVKWEQCPSIPPSMSVSAFFQKFSTTLFFSFWKSRINVQLLQKGEGLHIPIPFCIKIMCPFFPAPHTLFNVKCNLCTNASDGSGGKLRISSYLLPWNRNWILLYLD